MLPTVRELGIGFVAYSPLGRGFLSGRIRSVDDLDDGRLPAPGAPLPGRELREEPRPGREGRGARRRRRACTPAQLALAWVLARGDDIVPIPGTKRVSYLEENVVAAEIELTADELRELDDAFPPGAAAGDRYANMSTVNQ